MDDYTIEFVGGLANTPISLITVDTSNLFTSASTINVVETQAGIADVPDTAAVNVITFSGPLENGDFSIQHSEINSGTPVDISINNVSPILSNITTGTSSVSGVPQTYVLTFDSVPSSGNFWLSYQSNYNFLFDYQGQNTNFNGNPRSTIQAALDVIGSGGGYSGGPWTCSGGPQSGTLTFYGPESVAGASPWSIFHNYLGVTVTDSWTDGTAPITGVQAVHSLALPGAWDGTWAINSFSGIPWNIDVGTLATWWGNNTGQIVSPNIGGSGTGNDPWVVTYHDPGPVDLPTIDGTTLVGFTDVYLTSQIGDYFTVSGGDTNPYTLTSTALGSGESAIVVENVNMTASVDYSLSVYTVGVTPVTGRNPVYTLTLSGIPHANYLSLQYNGGSVIDIGYNNVDPFGNDIQTSLNNVGLGAWIYSGNPQTGGPLELVYNSEVALGSNPWTIQFNYWTYVGVNVTDSWQDGITPIVGANCVMRFYLNGATGGTFDISGNIHTTHDISYNVSADNLKTDWEAATDKTISTVTGSGTNDDAWVITYSEQAPEDMPTINAANLTQPGIVTNDFTDGTTTEGIDEIQTVTLADSPTGGTWSISYNNDDTVNPLDYNIAPQDLQAALRSNWGISTINVSKSGFTYTIDFGVHAVQFGTNTIQADGSGLTKPVIASVDRIRIGQTLQ